MRDSTIARNYAEVLLSLARKANDTEGWGQMLTEVATSVQRDERLRRFLDSPRIDAAAKNEILGKAFQDRMPRLFVRFLQALVSHHRQMLLPEVAVQYQAIVDRAAGRVHAQVTVAREMSAPERGRLADSLSRSMGKTVVPHITVNPEILGGVIVKVEERVMDGSVRRRLAVLRGRMLAGALR